MKVAGFPTSSDIYLEVDGKKVAVVQSYTAKSSRTSQTVEAEAALCANACLLARALERGGQPVFADGGAALAGLSAREIGALAGRWAAFDRAENPSPEDGEERLEGLKKAWSTRPMSAFAGVCSNALARFRRRSGPNR